MQNIAILGSTGSIGRQALEIVSQYKDKFNVVALCCDKNIETLKMQVEKFKPKYVVVSGKKVKSEDFANSNVKVLNSLEEISMLDEVESILFATVGFAGVKAVIAAIENKKRILLANKEALVCAGEIIMKKAKENNVSILPVDSEHSALWQCARVGKKEDISKAIITASGGAFRELSLEQMKNVKATDALKHPNWQMGNKITIDCATMMNKGFEVMEAKWLFGLAENQIECVLHKESIIHSMVEFCDGSVIAQMSYPSMEIPIALALHYPNRLQTSMQSLDLKKVGALTFSEISKEKYPCFDLCLQVMKTGGTMPTALNGANEVFVAEFLKNNISFLDIYKGLSKIVEMHSSIANPSLEQIIQSDIWAREQANKLCLN